MNGKLSRRQFLKFFTAATSGTIAAWARGPSTFMAGGYDEETEGKIYLPKLANGTSTPLSTGSRVVHVHSNNATSWNGSDPQYWNYVDQGVVNNMVDRGLLTLTGASTVPDAWRALLPNYHSGQKIAIKVNFNNTKSCDSTEYEIDAIAEPVNAVIKGLTQIGVSETDIWIYDAVRAIPSRFESAIQYGNVSYFDKYCRGTSGFSSNDPNAFVVFGIGGMEANRISDVLINANYLINMPIMKRHSMAGVSLAFKNHFGTIEKPMKLHDYINLYDSNYSENYTPLVDVYRNPHILEKTILIIGDGIFSALSTDSPPVLWDSLGNHLPNSIFLATDPVAADCVMCDVLGGESEMRSGSDDYLKLASGAGLGVFERGTPFESTGYNQIDYQYEEL